MKTLLTFLALTLALTTARADRITAIITLTNIPVNGETLVVNANTRTWTNSVTTSSAQILIGSAIGDSATNLWNQITGSPFAGPITPTWVATNQINLTGANGQAMAVTLTTNWGVITYSTQTVATLTAVRVPIAAETTANARTNIAGLLVYGIDTYSPTAFSAASPSLANHVNISTAQAIGGAKTFTTSIAGTVANLTNGLYTSPVLLNPSMTNGQNFGNPFRSPGTGTASEQFGTAALALANNAVALGNGAQAGAHEDIAIGKGAVAGTDSYSSVTVGGFSLITNSIGAVGLGNAVTVKNANHGIAIGDDALVGGYSGIGIGYLVIATNSASVAIGTAAQTTEDNQIVLGTGTEHITIPGTLRQTTFTQTNNSTGDWATTQAVVNTLANGNNADLDFGTTEFVKLTSGPSGAFAICGVAGARDGRHLKIYNNTGQNMTIAHQSGVEPTASRRVVTMTGADVATTADGFCELIYDASASRWVLQYLTP